jgi:hypothetical protein
VVVGGSLEGSYDLTFRGVTLSPGQGPQPPQTGTPPSIGVSARLDLRANASGGYDAVLTPRWGDPSAYTVMVTTSTVALSGGSANVVGGGMNDTWSAITLARADDGGLRGDFTASGDEEVTEGDEVLSSNAAGTGTLARDATAPATRTIAISSSEGPSTLLPWDPIRVRVAEPVDAAQLMQALSLSALQTPVHARWTTEGGASNADWAGAVQAKGLLTTWDSALGPATLSIGPLTDRVGNASSASTTPVAIMGLVQTAPPQSFDTDVTTVGSWGTPAPAFLGAKSGSDPSCEKGGCVELGPFPNSVCGAPGIGLAGVFTAPGATNVVVRYRVLVAPGNGPPDMPPETVDAALAVDAASPGVDAKTTQATPQIGDFTKLAAPILGMSWATAWTTLQAPIPGAGPLVGFTVRAGGYVTNGPCGGPAPPPVTTVVLVDSVDAR